MESKFDETKNNLLQSKYPPDIVGFCETFFHEIIRTTTWLFDNSCTLSINIWVSEDDIGL
jgi:hypothetical protein